MLNLNRCNELANIRYNMNYMNVHERLKDDLSL